MIALGKGLSCELSVVDTTLHNLCSHLCVCVYTNTPCYRGQQPQQRSTIIVSSVFYNADTSLCSTGSLQQSPGCQLVNKPVSIGSGGYIYNQDIFAVHCLVHNIKVVKLFYVGHLIKDFDGNDAVDTCLYDAPRAILFCLVSKCDTDATGTKNFGVLVLGLNYSSFNPLRNLTLVVGGQNGQITYPVWDQLGE